MPIIGHHVPKTAIFENSRWRTAAILKIALSSYLSCELSDFDEIWYTDADFHSEDGHLTYNQNFANSRWWTDAILKIVFRLYLGAILADQRKIWNGDEESLADIRHVPKTVIFFQKFKMADVRHFENMMNIFGDE